MEPEPDQVPSSPAPPQEPAAADDEPEREDPQEEVASEKDEPDSAVQTRRGLSLCTVIVTLARIPKRFSHSIGKRKADTEADPKREKKKSREISEPLEESEPEPGKDIPELLWRTLSTPLLFPQRQPRNVAERHQG